MTAPRDGYKSGIQRVEVGGTDSSTGLWSESSQGGVVSLGTYLTGENYINTSATVSSIAGSTLTMTADIDYDSGDQIVISGSATSGANGTFTLTKITPAIGTLLDSTGTATSVGNGATDGDIEFTHLRRGEFISNRAGSGYLTDRTGQAMTIAANDPIDTNLDCSTFEIVWVWFSVTNSLLDEFTIQGSVDGVNFFTLYSTAAQYQAPTGILIGTGTTDGTGNLTVVPDGETGWYTLDCSGLMKIRHLLSSDTAESTVIMRYSGK